MSSINPFASIMSDIKSVADGSASSVAGGVKIGTIISISPLSIKVDDKNVLSSSFFIVPYYLKELEIEIDIGHTHEVETESVGGGIEEFQGNTQPTPRPPAQATPDVPNHIHEMTHTHSSEESTIKVEIKPLAGKEAIRKIKIFDGLKSGEQVILLSFNSGQKYLVAERA